MTPARERELLDIKGRLFAALRSGALGFEHSGFLKGFGSAMNSSDHGRPSQVQIDKATRLDGEVRRDKGSEPVSLLDAEDGG